MAGAEEVAGAGEPGDAGDGVRGAVEQARVVHVTGGVEAAGVLVAAEIDDLAGMQERGMDREDAGRRVVADLERAAQELLHDDRLAERRDVLAQALQGGHQIADVELAADRDRQVRATAGGGAAEDAVDIDVDARAWDDLHQPHQGLAGIQRVDDLRSRHPLDLADDHGVDLELTSPQPRCSA